MKSLRGFFLVAAPNLKDPNFYQTVVLMVQHGEEGALGLVLNRPTQLNVAELADDLDAEETTLCVGGPIHGPLMAIHAYSEFSERKICDGVFFTASRTHIAEIVRRPEGRLKLFVGYSGWGPGQLEHELKVGGWMTLPSNVEDIYETSSQQLWPRVRRKFGSQFLADTLDIKSFPDDPSRN